MSIKLEMLRVFQTVADEGSLTRAAARLGRTPSAISMTLAQLEDHIGDRLFETDRKNRLTPLGQLVLEESRRANQAFDHSTSAILRHAKSTAGTVRIAAVPSAMQSLLPNAVAGFHKARPDVRLEISDVDTASVLRRVQFDRADIGIISASSTAQTEGTVILTDRLGIVCHKDRPIAKGCAAGTPQDWTVLAQEPFIANPLCEMVTAPFVQDLLLTCKLEARNTTALLALVRHGIGATILPEGAIPADPTLRFLCPERDVVRRNLLKIQPPDRRLSPAAQLFWDQL